MPAFPLTVPVRCNRITSLSPLCFSLACNSNSVSLPRRPPGNVHLFGNSPSSFHRNLYPPRQRGSSLIAFDAKNLDPGAGDNQAMDAVLKLYSALKNKNTQELSEILADECRCVCNYLSFFQAFQGKMQVLEFFSRLIRILGNNVEIVVRPTLHDGMNVGIEWKFESDKIYLPLGKGFSFHICQTYQGRVLISNIEMFMEPLLHFEPFTLKMMASLRMLMERTGSFMVFESENKAGRNLCIVLATVCLAAFLFFLRLASCKAIS